MKKISKKWVKLTDELLNELDITKRQLYEHVYRQEWYDGFVIAKKRNGRKWTLFCKEDYEIWEGREIGQVA